MTRPAASEAVHARSARSFILSLSFGERLEDAVGDVTVCRAEAIQMAMQPVGARSLRIVDASSR
jgi:hypothetical protein